MLLTGYGVTTGAWGELPPMLTTVRRILVEYPGIAGAPPARGRLTTSRLADGVVAVLDQAGIDAACIVGVSFGGMVAQEAALRHPDRVRSLVLACTSPGGPDAPITDTARLVTLAGLRPRRSDTPDARLSRLVPLVFSETFRRDATSRLRDEQHRILAALAPRPAARRQLAALVTHDTSRRLGVIRQPTLVLHGGQDKVVPAANAVLLARLIPHATLAVFATAGHAFYLEHPDQVAEQVTAFVRATADTRTSAPAVLAGRDVARHAWTAARRARHVLRTIHTDA
jgi:3-oxoadipate enol-lactonase